jgi:hypothetical protein
MAWKGLTVDEFQLLGFFECEPQADEYGGFVFHVARGPHVVAFGMNPETRDVSLSVARDGETVFEFVSLSVPDVRWRGDGQRERLQIVLGERHNVFLELRPAVSVVHHRGLEVRI